MKNKLKTTLYDYLALTFASIVFCIAWEGFMIPSDLSSGGLMGLCTVIEYATGGTILASYSYLAINVGLIIIAVVIFGLGFGFRTLYCIGLTALLLKLFAGFEWLHAVPGNFLYVPEKVLVPVISGVLEAVGVGLMIKHGGSSGGTDIIALMVNKYYPVSLSKMFLITDCIIITSILLLPGRAFGDMIYGYLMAVTFSVVIDFVVVGDKGTVQLLIFSSKYDQIADYINKDLERGVTSLKAQGWYTKKDKEVLLVLIRRNELPALSKFIKNVDDKAFLSVSNVGSVYGEGFEEIKTGIVRKKNKNGND